MEMSELCPCLVVCLLCWKSMATRKVLEVKLLLTNCLHVFYFSMWRHSDCDIEVASNIRWFEIIV
jgi:hypothetical protein